MTRQFHLLDNEATEQFGALLWSHLPEKSLIFLHGDLGAGKTTLVRGLLRAAGVTGTIKSPTYALIEEYNVANRKIFHFDLYRLADPEELEWIGIDDYLNENALCFIEWSCKGAGVLPKANVNISLIYQDDGRLVQIDGLEL
ncbi:MAG: tRNA (adenosine(37)-N6)-threonylcarbamoyltransferase complex ATPase subunit type 1 TsaE [Methylococcales bacterium]|nr:tRNA (adenosine(37)-N6)-threonylcarbamoyltransferase complex ATPase subunit type 1 TsaE [Methylococcales bacterium]MDD5753532.1 tRNA (adenosine(37)-N6)-threonylcarbamoyltransferase complex ATPase subunit type 1 TsaE [Methylococcales bacterium]